VSERKRSTDREFWSTVAIGFLFFNVVAFPLWILRTYEEDRVARTRSGVSTVNPANGDGDLRIDAWTNTSRVSAKDMLPFSIAIQNPSIKTEVTDVRFIAFDAADGFAVPTTGLDAQCWSRERQPKPICTTIDKTIDHVTVHPDKWPLTIGVGGGATVATRLLAVDEPGRWYLTAVVAWTDTAHHLSRRKGISLGPIIVENVFRKNLLLFAKAAQTYLKDLFWPQLAALFAIWVKRQDDRRALQREDEKEEDDRRAQNERDARSTAERLAQENRAMVQQTWTLMLPTSHRNNEQFYMPISNAVSRIHARYAQIGTDRFAEDECFYFIWLLHKKMYDFAAQRGGWYLKNRRGEELIAAAWNCVVAWTDSIITPHVTTRSARALRDEAVALFPRRQITFADFSDHVITQQPLSDIRPWFSAALGPSAANIMTIFELIERVIDFEINRAYIYWYGTEQEMLRSESAEHLGNLDDIAARFSSTRAMLPTPPYDKWLGLLADEISRYRAEIMKSSRVPEKT
jgi:hypothetical protein